MKYNDDDHDTRDHGDDNDGDINNERDDYFSNIHFASDMDTDGLDNSCVERNVPSLQQTLQLPVLWTGKPSSHPARFDDNDEYMQPLEMGDMDFSVPLEANFYNNRPLMQRNQPFNKTSDDESMEVSSLHHSRLEYKPLSPQTTSKYSNIKKSDKDNISMLSFTQDKEINGNTHPFYGGEGDQSYDKDDVHANEYDGNSTFMSVTGRNKDILSEFGRDHNLETRQELHSSLYDDASQQHDTENNEESVINRKTKEVVSTTKLGSMSISLQELQDFDLFSKE
jgi:hypothetical protein